MHKSLLASAQTAFPYSCTLYSGTYTLLPLVVCKTTADLCGRGQDLPQNLLKAMHQAASCVAKEWSESMKDMNGAGELCSNMLISTAYLKSAKIAMEVSHSFLIKLCPI